MNRAAKVGGTSSSQPTTPLGRTPCAIFFRSGPTSRIIPHSWRRCDTCPPGVLTYVLIDLPNAGTECPAPRIPCRRNRVMQRPWTFVISFLAAVLIAPAIRATQPLSSDNPAFAKNSATEDHAALTRPREIVLRDR